MLMQLMNVDKNANAVDECGWIRMLINAVDEHR